MSLRAKLLALFVSLAVVPLLVLGGVEYARSLRALEALIAAQNARVARRVAETIGARSALLRSDLLLLADNAETQGWLAQHAEGRGDSAAAREADRFVRDAWSRMGSSYAGLVYRDAGGQVIYRLGAMFEGDPQSLLRPDGETLGPVEQPVRDLRSGVALGAVSISPTLAATLPLDVLASGFGETGYGLVLDRRGGRVLYHPNRAMLGAELAPLIAGGTWDVAPGALERPAGTFRFRAGDTLRVASFVSLMPPAPPWTVVVSGAVSEFAGPFTAVRRWTLLLFLAVALLATVVFRQLLRRTTRSLEDLTAATAVVGRGDFAPTLPQAGHDEVGRLTASFETMVGKIREMVSQIESSRQMAVLGEFAAHLSHEIRNPLTSIKLNLQKLEREGREGRLPESTAKPLEISLREVERLDGVVRGVLDLARLRPRETAPCSVRRLAEETVETLVGQAESQGVRIERDFAAGDDRVNVDPSQLKGALLNLALNALDAMPLGGTLRLGTRHRNGRIQLWLADSGAGIPAAARSEIFRPFFTTKSSGTGLGLSLAQRAIEDNGGSLVLAAENGTGGAEFVIELPLSGAP
jgi:signal transduction histidine kinase